MVGSGRLGRAYPSDETRLRSGVALHFEDHSISIHMLTDKCPIHYICLKKPIHHERGYIFYEFISDLYSRFRTPQPTKPPTNLIAIPTTASQNSNTFCCRRHKGEVYIMLQDITSTLILSQ